MKQILLETPVWVWILFIGLLYLGVKRCFTSTTPIKKLFIIPAIFIVMGIENNLLMEGATFLHTTYWLLGGFVGAGLGYLQVRNKKVKADKARQVLEIPGDFFMLIFIIAIFIVEFYIHYMVAAHPVLANTPAFKLKVLVLSGIIVGATMGRNLGYFLKYLRQTSWQK